MRHSNHRHTLGVTKEHRAALVANLASALFLHGQIRTTLAKAKALRPFAEKVITMAKKAAAATEPAVKVHYLRLALSRVRNKQAIYKLFNERASEFASRNGGYIRIYKLVPGKNAADMALIQLISAADEGYKKPSKKAPAKKAESIVEEAKA